MRPYTSAMMVGKPITAFSVGVSPTTASASAPWSGAPIVTPSVTVSQLTGAPSTLTYAWSLLSGGSITATSPTSATTTFSASPSENSTITGTMRCTVTNGFGQVTHVDVPVSVTAGWATLAFNFSPENINISRSVGAGAVSQDATASAISNGTGPYTYSWNGGGFGSSFTGQGTTVSHWTIPTQSVGTVTHVGVGLTVTDSIGRTGSAFGDWFITWTV